MLIFFGGGGLWTIFKGFVEFTTILLLLFMFWFFFFFGHEACGILTPQPGVEPVIPCIGKRCLNFWTSGEILK